MRKNIDINSVSIVIPMYNSERTIIRALESILSQTAFEYIREIIVVNDGSLDNSMMVVENYKAKHPNVPITLINKPNGGVSSARNTGMKKASGSWFALLDSDDEWLSNKLELQIMTINSHEDIDFLGGAINSSPLRIFSRTISQLYKVKIKDLCIKMFPQTSTVLFRRKIFDTIGGYDENQHYAEDGNYHLKICKFYNYYYLPVEMVIFDGGKPGFGSGGLSGNLFKMHQGNLKNIKELRVNRDITLGYYLFLVVFYQIKFFRRVLITKKNKLMQK